jgi:hypothetical protein
VWLPSPLNQRVRRTENPLLSISHECASDYPLGEPELGDIPSKTLQVEVKREWRASPRRSPSEKEKRAQHSSRGEEGGPANTRQPAHLGSHACAFRASPSSPRPRPPQSSSWFRPRKASEPPPPASRAPSDPSSLATWLAPPEPHRVGTVHAATSLSTR